MGVKGLTITLIVQGLSLKMNIEVSWEKKKKKISLENLSSSCDESSSLISLTSAFS